MKANSGSETHHKRCKSFLIQDPHGLGYSPKNVMNINAQLRTVDSINHNQKISKKTQKLVKLFSMVKVKSLAIQLKTEHVSVQMIQSAFMVYHSSQLSIPLT